MCKQMVHVRANGKANADKGRKCRKMVLVKTNVADADMFGEMLQITWAGNERSGMRSTTVKNHETPERERKRK